VRGESSRKGERSCHTAWRKFDRESHPTASVSVCPLHTNGDKLRALGVAVPWKAEGSSRNGDWNQKSAIEWLSICGTAKEDWINRIIETLDESIVTGGYIGRQDDSQQPSDWDGDRHAHRTPSRARDRV
jgi:hypothetical protein